MTYQKKKQVKKLQELRTLIQLLEFEEHIMNIRKAIKLYGETEQVKPYRYDYNRESEKILKELFKIRHQLNDFILFTELKDSLT